LCPWDGSTVVSGNTVTFRWISPLRGVRGGKLSKKEDKAK
jgi:hypothetical protein